MANVRFFGFSSAVPPAPDSQDGGADGPKVNIPLEFGREKLK
jgi:hypothetical protein